MTLFVYFYGGPCTGKSTAALTLASELKRRGMTVGFVGEAVSEMIVQGRKPTYADQFALFGEQVRREQQWMGSVDVVVSESPPGLAAFYASRGMNAVRIKMWADMVDAYHNYCFETHEQRHILLDGGEFEYIGQNRIHSEEEARYVQQELKEFMHHDTVLVYETHNPVNMKTLIATIVAELEAK